MKSFLRRLRKISLSQIVMILTLLLFLATLFSTGADSPVSAQQGANANFTNRLALAQGQTALPPEYYNPESQTNGIILGGVLLVLVVVGGTAVVLSSKHHSSDS